MATLNANQVKLYHHFIITHTHTHLYEVLQGQQGHRCKRLTFII